MTATRVSLPSGLWSGHYEQHGQHYPQEMTLGFADGLIRGDGRDGLGPFAIEGEYRAEEEEVRLGFIKTYDGAHSVLYLGQLASSTAIEGGWQLGSHRGEFALSWSPLWTYGSRVKSRPPSERMRAVSRTPTHPRQCPSERARSSSSTSPTEPGDLCCSKARPASARVRSFVNSQTPPGSSFWCSIPGRRRRPPKPRLLVGVDTSGSMDGDALARIGEELSSLARHARLTIVECDSAVQRIYPFSAALQRVTGGGDTEFAPVFAVATREYEGLVYFTDGKGALPELPPALPTVWALTNDDPFLAAFGMVVRLPV